MRIIEFGLYLKSLEESLKGFKQTHDIISIIGRTLVAGWQYIVVGQMWKPGA